MTIRNYRGGDPGPFMGHIQNMSFQAKNMGLPIVRLRRETLDGEVSLMRVNGIDYVTISPSVAEIFGGLAASYRFINDQYSGWQTKFKLIKADNKSVSILNTVDMNLTFPVGDTTDYLYMDNLGWSQKHQAFVAICGYCWNPVGYYETLVSLVSLDGSIPLFKYPIEHEVPPNSAVSNLLRLKKSYNPERHYYLIVYWNSNTLLYTAKVLIFDEDFNILSSRMVPLFYGSALQLGFWGNSKSAAMYDDETIISSAVVNTGTWTYNNVMFYLYPDNSSKQVLLSAEVVNPYASYSQSVVGYSIAAGDDHLIYSIVTDTIVRDESGTVIAPRTWRTQVRIANKANPLSFEVIDETFACSLPVSESHNFEGSPFSALYLAKNGITVLSWSGLRPNPEFPDSCSYLALFNKDRNLIYKSNFTGRAGQMDIYLAEATIE